MSNGMQGLSFKGVYKVTLPKVDTLKDENEKNAATDAVINTVVMGCNMSIDKPKTIQNGDSGITYFKIDDRNDANFEKGFKSIVDNCNKKFNTDVASKVYMEKVSEEEFKK